MSISLSLACTPSSKVIPISNQPRLLYLLVEIAGGKGAQTLPSNLGFILDTSDSMHIRLVSDAQFLELAKNGQAQEIMTDGVPAYQIKSIPNDLLLSFPRRIDYVSEALMIASEYLRPVDRFSLIAFASRPQSMISSSPGTEKLQLHQAARELEYMRLGNETHMDMGIALAFDEILRQAKRTGSPSYASRLILLTDGHTRNVGKCYDWAKQARQKGLKLTTMGIGSEFNEDLLIPLADLTGGNAYYIESPEQIPQAFRQELGAALRVSYRNVEVKVQLSAGVDLRRVHRVLPEISNFDPGPGMGSSYSLMLGDYDPAAPVTLLLELVLPPRPAGTYRLAQTLLAWDDPEDSMARPSQRQDIVLEMSDQATTPLNGRVMNIVERVGAFKMGTHALKTAQIAAHSAQGQDKKAATVRLRQAATRLLDMGEQLLAETMLRQAESLERSGDLDPDASKKLRYETRRLTQRP
ncbi:VWA domain-containing protein [Chloroflexota bacterium]